MASQNLTDDYDTPWKEILENYFQEFLAFFFPYAAESIDWDKGYIFLDKEFQKITKEAKQGRKYADKLVQVWKKDGSETWILIHVEIQGQYEIDFAERMFVYYYRIFDKFRRKIASFAVLGDENPNWRPKSFHSQLWNCELSFKFDTVKLLEYRKQWQKLENSTNPFSVVVMAHLKVQETKKDVTDRRMWKFKLIKGLYERGYGKDEIIKLFSFIDWIMTLPKEAEALFWQDIKQYEEKKKMSYVTIGERIGIEKGIQQGLQQGLQQGIQQGKIEEAKEMVIEALEERFEIISKSIIDQIRSIEHRDILRSLLRQAIRCSDLKSFKVMLAKALN